MSTYEWESGTIKIPAKAWPGFRKGLIEAWNAEQLEFLRQAERVRTAMIAAGKGKRGATRTAAMRQTFMNRCGLRLRYGYWEGGDAAYSTCEALLRLLFGLHEGRYPYSLPDREPEGEQRNAPPWTKPRKPKRSDLDLRPITKSTTLDLGEASITLDNDTRSVHWNVPENNHARDHAHQIPLARKMFRMLNSIRWTRGSGGQIVGNDEYNQDSYEAGGGANYVTHQYPPAPIGGRTRRLATRLSR